MNGKNRQDMLTDENKNDIQIMYDNGYAPEDIANNLGLDETEVMDYCVEVLWQ